MRSGDRLEAAPPLGRAKPNWYMPWHSVICRRQPMTGTVAAESPFVWCVLVPFAGWLVVAPGLPVGG